MVIPFKVIITPGQENYVTQAEILIGDTKNAFVMADKAYDCDRIRTKIQQQKCIAVIPSKSNRKNPYDYDKERHVIECFLKLNISGEYFLYLINQGVISHHFLIFCWSFYMATLKSLTEPKELQSMLYIEQFTSIIKTTKHGIQRLIERKFTMRRSKSLNKKPRHFKNTKRWSPGICKTRK